MPTPPPLTSTDQAAARLFGLNIRAIWRELTSSPWSFRLTCLYVFFEYVRPQQIYSALQGPPWALASILMALLAFSVEGAKFRSNRTIAWASFAFFMIVFASSVTAVFPGEALKELPVIINWAIAFILIANTANSERRFFVFIVLFLLWSLKMSQHGFISWAKRGFGFASWGVSGAPGWFQNSGEFALQMSIFVPLSLYFISATKPFVSRTLYVFLWVLPITGIGAVIASSSRGGYLALALVGFVTAVRSQKRVRNLVVLAALAPVLWTITPEQQKARFQTAGKDATSQLRLLYWQRGMEMARENPVLGIGYNNWIPVYRNRYFTPGDTNNRFDRRGELKIEVAHNSFVEVASQLGFSGLLLFVWLIVLVFLVNARSRRVLRSIGARGRFLDHMSRGLDDGIIAFSVAGYFMSVAFYPFLWFHLGMTAGLHAAAVSLVRSAKGKPIKAYEAAVGARSEAPQHLVTGRQTFRPWGTRGGFAR